jgi:hypothetical protein
MRDQGKARLVSTTDRATSKVGDTAAPLTITTNESPNIGHQRRTRLSVFVLDR